MCWQQACRSHHTSADAIYTCMWLTWTHGGTQRGEINCWLYGFGQPHMTVGESAGAGYAWLDFWCLCTRDSTQSAWIWLQVALVVILTDSVLLPTQFTICFLIELFYVRVSSSQLSVNEAVHSASVCCMSSDACCGYRCQSSHLCCRIRPRTHPSALLFLPLFSSFFPVIYHPPISSLLPFCFSILTCLSNLPIMHLIGWTLNFISGIKQSLTLKRDSNLKKRRGFMFWKILDANMEVFVASVALCLWECFFVTLSQGSACGLLP